MTMSSEERPSPAAAPGHAERVAQTPPIIPTDPDWNVSEMLMHRVRETPELPIFSVPHGEGWRDVTAREFHADVVAIAKGLAARGVEPGDRIAFVCRTSYEWSLVDFALWFAGAIMVPVYETSSPAQIAWVLEDSEAKGVISQSREHGEHVSQALEKTRQAAAQAPFHWHMHDGLLDALRAEGAGIEDSEIERRRTIARGDDMATLIYTSGSMGRPKGCVLSHTNFIDLARNTGHRIPEVMYEGATTLLFITLAHVFARFISILAVYGGIKVGHQADTTKLVPSLSSFRPTFLLAVPRVFEKVYNAAEQKAEAGKRGRIFRRAAKVAIAYSRALDTGRVPLGLKLQHRLFDRLVYSKLRTLLGGRVLYAVSGSAPLGERLGHFYRGIGLRILEGYGLTETSAPFSVNLPEDIKIGTVGPPLPGSAARIAEDGEIEVRGVGVFREYWKNPEATAESFRDGWFRTGDIGSIDEDGHITVTGRKKEIIVTAGGKNVSPAALENPIRAYPIISQIVVVGDKRPFISAIITLDEDMLPAWLENHGENPAMPRADATRNQRVLSAIQQEIDRANEHVSRAESIRKFVVLDAQFTEEDGTLTPKMSIRRHAILERYAEAIEGIYSSNEPPANGASLG